MDTFQWHLEQKVAIYIPKILNIYFIAIYLSQKHIVGLVFDGHEHNEDAIKELKAFQWSSAHIEEYAE